MRKRIGTNNPYATTHENTLMRYIHHAQQHPRSPHNATAKNRNAAREAKKQNNSELEYIDYRGRRYITPIVKEIRKQLTEVQSILYKLQFTREYVSDWTLDNINILQRVKQTLLNALHIILYPKEKHPSLYNFPKNKIVFIKNERAKINERAQIKVFFQPIIELIYSERVKIVDAKGKISNLKGEIYGYNIPVAIILNTVDTQLLEVLYMIL